MHQLLYLTAFLLVLQTHRWLLSPLPTPVLLLFTDLHPVTRAIALYERIHVIFTATARATEFSHQRSTQLLRWVRRPNAAMARTVSASLVGVPVPVMVE